MRFGIRFCLIYASLAREGYVQNAIVHRAVKLVAENAASVAYLVYEGASVREQHPLLDLLARPNPRQEGSGLLEALYAHLLLAGNAYVEVVSLDGAVRELYALRPDRMRVVPGSDGWPLAYEYTVAGESVRFDQRGSPTPILHLTQFHPLDDHYGLSSLEAAAVAVDIDPEHEPMNREHKSNMPQVVIDAFKAEGAYWGGDFRNRQDPMHFQFATE